MKIEKILPRKKALDYAGHPLRPKKGKAGNRLCDLQYTRGTIRGGVARDGLGADLSIILK